MKKTLLAIALLAGATQAQAEQGFFVQGDFGTAHSALSFSEDDSYSGDEMTAGVKIGYGFNDNWSLQLQRANAGEFNIDESSSTVCGNAGCGTLTERFDSEASYTALMAQYQSYVSAQSWSFAGRFGLVFAKNTITYTAKFGTAQESVEFDDSPVGFVAGVGAQYNFTENLSFVADLDLVPFSTDSTKELVDESADYHVTRVVVGAKYVF